MRVCESKGGIQAESDFPFVSLLLDAKHRPCQKLAGHIAVYHGMFRFHFIQSHFLHLDLWVGFMGHPLHLLDEQINKVQVYHGETANVLCLLSIVFIVQVHIRKKSAKYVTSIYYELADKSGRVFSIHLNT